MGVGLVGAILGERLKGKLDGFPVPVMITVVLPVVVWPLSFKLADWFSSVVSVRLSWINPSIMEAETTAAKINKKHTSSHKHHHVSLRIRMIPLWFFQLEMFML